MKRQNIIVVISPNDQVETFGNFKKMCKIKGFPYHSLKTKDFPFIYQDVRIYRTPFL